jgi:putative transposase
MGPEAIHPGPRTTVDSPDHKVYPYLPRGVAIGRRDQVWSSDVTYIPMHQGFMHLTAVIDWYSRYVPSWSLSNGLDGRSRLETLEEALRGGAPEIFNTDQGVRYTARSFTGRLESAGVSVSMDGRGRALDNVFVERLRRSLEYEEAYLKDYRSVAELVSGLTSWFRFYNHERPHQGLKYRTPAEVDQGAGRGSR